MFNDLKKRSSQGFRAEFVPAWIQYASVYVYVFWRAVTSGSLLRYTATNPGFELGGLYPTSKDHVNTQLDPQWIPKTYKIDRYDGSFEDLQDSLTTAGLSYPLIIKPDNGLRGLGVEVLHTPGELEELIVHNNYFTTQHRRSSRLIQEFIDHPLEVGVFYVRQPGAETGTITGIVAKEFLQVTGDGEHTLEQLVEAHERAVLHREMLEQKFTQRRKKIIEVGVVIDLVEIGTHSRGSTFVDASHHSTPELIAHFDQILSQVEGFYYGRYDVRVASRDALQAGDFKIIELNTTYAEPTRMYDPSYSFWQAQKILLHHRSLMYQIATANHARGVSYATIRERNHVHKQFLNPGS